MSVTTAFAAGYDTAFCSTPCSTTRALPTFNSSSHRPYSDHGVLPAMMLAAADAGQARALIDRGIASDGTVPSGEAYFVRTTDLSRNVRWPDFLATATAFTGDGGLSSHYLDALDGGPEAVTFARDVMFYFTGLQAVPGIDTNAFRPGAVADHLTSFGGMVPQSGQMSILRWLEAGATASYGTVVEPCNYETKFPQASVMVRHYFRGEPVIEAYWKSVAMPGEGLFIGEPLARPFDQDSSEWDPATQALRLTTGRLAAFTSYAIESADSPEGPWTLVRGNVTFNKPARRTLTIQPVTARYYRIRGL
jgi:uncharacterized protein (TIGR03790 family)